MIKETLPQGIPVVFISSVTGFGLDELKDVLWKELNSESNKLAAITTTETIVHRPKEVGRLQHELEDEGEDGDFEYIDEDDIEDLEDVEYYDLEDEEYEDDDKR